MFHFSRKATRHVKASETFNYGYCWKILSNLSDISPLRLSLPRLPPPADLNWIKLKVHQSIETDSSKPLTLTADSNTNELKFDFVKFRDLRDWSKRAPRDPTQNCFNHVGTIPHLQEKYICCYLFKADPLRTLPWTGKTQMSTDISEISFSGNCRHNFKSTSHAVTLQAPQKRTRRSIFLLLLTFSS